jgi:hypothetical protein
MLAETSFLACVVSPQCIYVRIPWLLHQSNCRTLCCCYLGGVCAICLVPQIRVAAHQQQQVPRQIAGWSTAEAYLLDRASAGPGSWQGEPKTGAALPSLPRLMWQAVCCSW